MNETNNQRGYRVYHCVIDGDEMYDEFVGEWPTEAEAWEHLQADMKAQYAAMVRTFGEAEVYLDEGSIEVGRIDFETGKPSRFNLNNWLIDGPENDDLPEPC